MQSEIDDAEFRNIYLIVGVRGDFNPRTPSSFTGVGGILLHTLERWGISTVPWGRCDSGADLESPGGDVLRGWAHVDLQHTPYTQPHRDIPVSGLLRATWDSLELFGEITLTGVDASVPLIWAEDRTQIRVLNSDVLDHDRAARRPPRVYVEVDNAARGSAPIHWDARTISDALSEWVTVHVVGDSVPRATYRPLPAEEPFGRSGNESFRAELGLPAWTIDDAAWLTEAVAVSCRQAGVTDDVQIAVRLAQEATVAGDD
jgi:hypothetical protein